MVGQTLPIVLQHGLYPQPRRMQATRSPGQTRKRLSQSSPAIGTDSDRIAGSKSADRVMIGGNIRHQNAISRPNASPIRLPDLAPVDIQTSDVDVRAPVVIGANIHYHHHQWIPDRFVIDKISYARPTRSPVNKTWRFRIPFEINYATLARLGRGAIGLIQRQLEEGRRGQDAVDVPRGAQMTSNRPTMNHRHLAEVAEVAGSSMTGTTFEMPSNSR